MPNLNLLNRHLPKGVSGAPDALGTEALALSIKRASAVSGVSVPSLYREAGKGNLVLLKYGRTTLVDMASLRSFLASLPRASIRPPRTAA